MKHKLLLGGLVVIIIGSILLFKKPEEKKPLSKLETKGMISYTVDGKSVQEPPTKEDGYIANKIVCEGTTNIVWDNTNWEVEITEIENKDACTIDFTSDVSTSGYRVTVDASISEGIDSLSKATVSGGTVTFLPNSGYSLTAVSGCSNASIVDGRLIVTDVTSNQTCNATVGEITLYDELLSDNPTRLTRTSFDTVFEDENVNTLYTVNGNWTEDGSTVYYFAGNAQNNWVKFGKDQDGADLYWRIIRTNEDGSIRMLYVGTDVATESANPVLDGTSLSGGSGTTGMYNSTYNNTMYVGYMYGTTGSLASNRTNETSSPIKTVIDNWYSKTINTKTDGTYTYDSYVSKTAIYCNDRSTDAYSTTANMYYGAYRRLITNKQPSYKCGNNATGTLYSTADVADKFSVSTTSGGNGDLTYGVALMTADEIAYAGGKQSINAKAWYYYNADGGSAVESDFWWTMSSFEVYSSGNALVFVVNGSSSYAGRLGSLYASDTSPGVRPVVSLKSCVLKTGGNGSSTNPYTVKVNAACASAEN